MLFTRCISFLWMLNRFLYAACATKKKILLNIFSRNIIIYSWPLNNSGLNCTSPLTSGFFSINIQSALCIHEFPINRFNQLQLKTIFDLWLVGNLQMWICRCEFACVNLDTKGQFKLYPDVPVHGRSELQPLHFSRVNCRSFSNFSFKIALEIATEKEVSPTKKVCSFAQFSTLTLRKPSLQVCFTLVRPFAISIKNYIEKHFGPVQFPFIGTLRPGWYLNKKNGSKIPKNQLA